MPVTGIVRRPDAIVANVDHPRVRRIGIVEAQEFVATLHSPPCKWKKKAAFCDILPRIKRPNYIADIGRLLFWLAVIGLLIAIPAERERHPEHNWILHSIVGVGLLAVAWRFKPKAFD